jgi:hypothetical protein
MEPSTHAPEQDFVKALRQRRAELRESMSALEQALAAPTPEGRAQWVQRVHVALVELSADFHAHIDITEGPEGLYRELGRIAPRLSDPVTRLTHEHALIRERLDGLLARASSPAADEDVDTVRGLATELLAMLIRHRQRGADLVFEAYEVDIGGET